MSSSAFVWRDEDEQAGYSVDSLICLLKAVRAHDPRITQVRIEGRRLPPAYIVALLQAIGGNPYIEKIKLSKTGATDEITHSLCLTILESRSLHSLDLSRNALTCNLASFLAHSLAVAAATNDTCCLKRLDLEGNDIGHVGLSALCRAIPKTGIQTLKIGKNPWSEGSRGWASIVKLLQAESALVRLDLRKVEAGLPQVSHLAGALSNEFCTLQYLNLSDNVLDSDALVVISLALKANRSLATLDVQRNLDLGDVGVATLVHTLKTRNHVLQRVKIRRSAVSEQQKNELLEWLMINSHGPELAKRTKLALHKHPWISLTSSPPQHGKKQLRYRDCLLEDSDESDHTNSDDEREIEEGTEQEQFKLSEAAIEATNECVICFDRTPECALLLPCQHFNCCKTCSARLKDCHMCRTTIVVVKVFPARFSDEYTALRRRAICR